MNAPMTLPSQIDWPELIGDLMARGYSLRMIAAECRVHRMSVRNWRAGTHMPKADASVLLIRLHRATAAEVGSEA